MTESKADLAERAWRTMSAMVLDHDRKVAVSEVLASASRGCVHCAG